MINNLSFDSSNGFILAVYLHHVVNTTINLNFAQEHFIMLDAMPKPAPAPPLYNLPPSDPTDNS